jgi:hypothetical protein
MVNFEYSDANYGGDDELRECTNHGLVFFGYHDAGSSYGPMRFAAPGDGSLYYACTDVADSSLIVEVSEEGEVNQDHLTGIRNFLKVEKLARKLCICPFWEWELELE